MIQTQEHPQKLSHQGRRVTAWSLATEFVAGFICGLWIGHVIDQRYVIAPWGLVGGGVLGFIVGVWNVWKQCRNL